MKYMKLTNEIDMEVKSYSIFHGQNKWISPFFHWYTFTRFSCYYIDIIFMDN